MSKQARDHKKLRRSALRFFKNTKWVDAKINPDGSITSRYRIKTKWHNWRGWVMSSGQLA